MKKESRRKEKMDPSQRRPEEELLDGLRPQIKQKPNLALPLLEGLNPKAPAPLSTAVGILSTAWKVEFFDGPKGNSHQMAGSSLEALRLGSGDLQRRIQELGPLVAVYMEQDALGPSFMYDLRRHYSPSEALTPSQLKALSVPPSGDTLDFFSEHPDLLEDLIRGLSDRKWNDSQPYFNNAFEPRFLQKKLKGHQEKAAQVLAALMAPSGLFADQRLILILRELMGQSMREVSPRFPGLAVDSIRRKTALSISHLVDSTRPDSSRVDSTLPDPSVVPSTTGEDLQLQIELGKKQASDHARKQEKKTLNSMVAENVISSRKHGRDELKQGKESIGSYWVPTKTHNYRAPLKTSSTFEILSAPPKGQPNPSLQHIRITPLLYRALVRSVLRSGEEWTYQDISKLYKLLKGVGPVMRVPQVEEKKSLDAYGKEQLQSVNTNHLVRTSDAFHVLFRDWGENRQVAADIELFEEASGRTEAARQRALKTFAQAIKVGLELLSEDAKARRIDAGRRRKKRAPL